MDIVDAQLHVSRGRIQPTLEAMDALGIRSVLIDELWGNGQFGGSTYLEPGYALPNGGWRVAWPTAEQASILHPDRFSYLVRIDRRDPQLVELMRVVGSSPHARAFRVLPVWTLEEAAAFAAGAYEQLFAEAECIGLPVCVFIPGFVELLPPYLERFPELTFIVDHCGMGFPNIPPHRPQQEQQKACEPDYFDEVLRIAAWPNAALKWSHAQHLFRAGHYPYAPLRPILRCAIQAFGVERIMWASDKTVILDQRWSDMLFCLRDDPELSRDEKEWILGRSARTILRWPAPGGEKRKA